MHDRGATTGHFGRVDVTLTGAARFAAEPVRGPAAGFPGRPPAGQAEILSTFALEFFGDQASEKPAMVLVVVVADPTVLLAVVDTGRTTFLVRAQNAGGGVATLSFEAGPDRTEVHVLEFRAEADATAWMAQFEGPPDAASLDGAIEGGPADWDLGGALSRGLDGAGFDVPMDAEAVPPEAAQPDAGDRAVPPPPAAPRPGPPPPSAGPATVLAHAMAEMPASAQVGGQVEVLFKLSRERQVPAADRVIDETVIAVRPESPVTVTLAARGYRLANGARRSRTLRLPAAGSAAAVARFTLLAVDPGRGEVTIVVRQGDEFPLATLRLTSEIVAAAADAGQVRAVADAAPPDPAVAGLPSIRIDESIAGNESVLDLAVQVGGSGAACTTAIGDKAAFVADTYARIAGLRARLAAEPDDADERLRIALKELRSIGVGLFQSLFSPAVRAFLWKHADELERLVIQTTGEFDIPWELVYIGEPGVPVDGQDVDIERFLGMRGATRWVYNAAQPTTVAVRRGRARYLCPAYTDRGLALIHTRDEALLVRRTFHAKVVRPGDATAMSKVITSGFDLLHFAGHGVWTASEPPDQRLLLARYRRKGEPPAGSSYSAADLRRDLPDRAMVEPGGAGPMVFLNACDVGKLDTSAAGLGGFPEAFLRGGVGVLIGCSWAVDDETAGEFVRDFYEALQGVGIADAMDTARRRALEKVDLSWLAYVAYAHPDATVQVA
jgi:hypothetical protein